MFTPDARFSQAFAKAQARHDNAEPAEDWPEVGEDGFALDLDAIRKAKGE